MQDNPTVIATTQEAGPASRGIGGTVRIMAFAMVAMWQAQHAISLAGGHWAVLGSGLAIATGAAALLLIAQLRLGAHIRRSRSAAPMALRDLVGPGFWSLLTFVWLALTTMVFAPVGVGAVIGDVNEIAAGLLWVVFFAVATLAALALQRGLERRARRASAELRKPLDLRTP